MKKTRAKSTGETIKKTLNDQNIKALKAAPTGRRVYAWDDLVEGFCVRVTDKGSKSYYLSDKLPGMSNTIPLRIAGVGDVTVKAARQTARDWKVIIHEDGKDPRVIEKAKDVAVVKEVAADGRRRFCNMLTAFSTHKKEIDKRKKDYTRQMTNYLKRCCLPIWKDRDWSSITADEMIDVVKQVRDTSGKGAGRAMLNALRTIGIWAVNDRRATSSVAATILAKHLFGEKVIGERELETAELKKVWTAARYMSNKPEGPIYLLLMLTGCRLNEVAKAKWGEINKDFTLWTIPGKRMKMKKDHIIPLTKMMVEVLRSVKRGDAGDYIFSVNSGKSPFRISGRSKDRMDAGCGFSDWVNHDLRRTVRSMCSPLGIPPHICERMIAHTKKDNYDKYQYLDEKRVGFEKWNAELASIVGWTPRLRLVPKTIESWQRPAFRRAA